VAPHRSTSTALTAIRVDHARQAPPVVHRHLPSFGSRHGPCARRRLRCGRRAARPDWCSELPWGFIVDHTCRRHRQWLWRFVLASRRTEPRGCPFARGARRCRVQP
jgi:hypothetical protein